jgi:hypothetical protein
MPTPTIPNGSQYFAATTYTGTGSTLAITNTTNGVSFQPDLVWMKIRSSADNSGVFDSVRGVQKRIQTNLTNAENTETAALSSFNSNGFTLGSNGQFNGNGSTYVGWQWKAGGTAVSNTSGSITSLVSANTTAGFSVITYTGTGANATVGHGLGAVPQFIIVKRRNAVSQWAVYHVSLGNTNTMYLNLTNTVSSQPTFWNSTTPTSSVISLGTDNTVNGSGDTYVAYCWAPVAGYSSFGSYTGNGSTDGTFVYLGFRPKWLLFRSPDQNTDWMILDASRNLYNPEINGVYADLSNAEDVYLYDTDFVSNGFKLRTSWNNLNQSGVKYIYMAFAENPFKYANAR